MVRNTGGVLVQMMGCTICDESAHVYTFPAFVLVAGATVTVHTCTGKSIGMEYLRGSGT